MNGHAKSLEAYPWLESWQRLRTSYPVIQGYINKLLHDQQEARKIVCDAYRDRHQPGPGRCALLTFHEDRVTVQHFTTAAELDRWMSSNPRGDNDCRLWLLEDLEPAWVDVLGGKLKIDPLIVGEQMNTFHFTDSNTIQTRLLPSMVDPQRSFAIRYFEFRQLQDEKAITADTNQMTFAWNMRRLERWKDIDTPIFKQKWRHSFARRCASFWTNQEPDHQGWDAVILLDPAFDCVQWRQPGSRGNSPNLLKSCTILQDPVKYSKQDKQWFSRGWHSPGSVQAKQDTSLPYHGGSQTLTKSTITGETADRLTNSTDDDRNLTSPLDEIVLHWTQLASKDNITAARKHAVNSTLYLLRYTANLWTQHLEVVQATIAQSEYFSDDHQARVDTVNSSRGWRAILNQVTSATLDMNYLRRLMSHFEAHMIMNLERLDVGSGSVDDATSATLPDAIRAAQKDFAQLNRRLTQYNARTRALSRVANELASLHASFKSVQDGELGLTLSVLASVVFPATLISSIFSMGGDFIPGGDQFWVFFAVAVPVTVISAVALVFQQKVRKAFAV